MNSMEMYKIASGIAFQRGMDYFEEVIPIKRMSALYKALRHEKPYIWFNNGGFIKFLLKISHIEHKNNNLYPPICSANCKYRMKYDSPKIQKNALRIETLQPLDRCGWNLKPDRIGGHLDDYYPCVFKAMAVEGKIE